MGPLPRDLHAVSRPRPRAGGWSSVWLGWLAACALALTCIEAFLLEYRGHLFTGGFLAAYRLESPAAVAAFLSGSLVIDAAAILGAWAVALPMFARSKLGPLQRMAVAALLGLVAPVTADFVRYHIHKVMGDLLDVDLILALAGNVPLEILAQSSSHLLSAGLVLVSAVVLALFFVRTLRLAERRGTPWTAAAQWPATATLWFSFAGALVAAIASLSASCLDDGPVCFGLRRKPAGAALARLVETATDVDRDGYGWLSEPPDHAPFDAGRHPYAIDLPANGIDENGVGGDHPAGIELPPEPTDAPHFAHRPHVLLVFLESFRADVIEWSVGEREVTPFLRQLAREGASSQAAYTSTPFTNPARAQLLGGRLVPFPGQTTMIDDFKANGYTVAWFSAQDDSFGNSEPLLGVDRADVFYDARKDAHLRSSRFTTPGSLSVSWKLLNQRVLDFLREHDPAQPLFLYANYHDTHFPYHHDELDRILDIDPLPRHRIVAQERSRVRETYANAAANVDRAIEALVEEWRRRLGTEPSIVIVTGDHGEALYEQGYLGHGARLDAEQSRVPFVLHGMTGDVPEPVVLSDVRGILQRALVSPGTTPARFVGDPQRQVLQYTPSISTPRLVVLRGIDETLSIDLRQRTATIGDERGERPIPFDEPDRERFFEAIHLWEAAQRTAAERDAIRSD